MVSIRKSAAFGEQSDLLNIRESLARLKLQGTNPPINVLHVGHPMDLIIVLDSAVLNRDIAALSSLVRRHAVRLWRDH